MTASDQCSSRKKLLQVGGHPHMRRPGLLPKPPGGMNEPDMKIIDVFICKVRKKLANASGGKDYIETVWGRGYVIREPSENAASVPA
jgi:DNA-binding response OmpR family regulator